MNPGKEQVSETDLAWWVTGPRRGALLQTSLASGQETDSETMVTVKSLYSGISRGTEALVFGGLVPETEYDRMRAPFQEGRFPFPVKYGYANVGRVVSGPSSLQDRLVFCLFPHQSRYRVPASAVTPVPDAVPAARAILAANMETAVNGLWDGGPSVGDRIAVVGLGVVGLLVAWLANQIPGTRVIAVDVNEDRRSVADALGLNFASSVSQDDHDLVFHTSGHPSGLDTALSLAGQESVIVEMSWYGDQTVTALLGGAFHSRRLTLRSSQVGQIPQLRQSRWNHRKRLQLALALLGDDRLDCLISGESPFTELPEIMGSILTEGHHTLCHRIVY
ncbi:zinc-dependent alcohol dehydrogenase [Marinobacter sp. F4206]|uniref:zinc-dependent alcohol dehydrogenase n=1 Tax=Marinobacter sp. F4206 TaxID=2861777 RepID=UPI001C5FECC5|nr:zinc-binding alcohol dehydrogenase [Marinobacter sp. F4206]MBW4933440.1 zinc-binding alcohol dehydrogenase [Marinobacter sp. F4206]